MLLRRISGPTIIAIALAMPARGAAQLGQEVVPRVIRSTVSIHTGAGSGSGWVYDAQNKLLVTNFHVVGKLTRLSNPLLGQERQQVIYDRVVVLFPAYRPDGSLITERQYYADNRERLQKEGRIVQAVVLDADMKRDLAVLRADNIPADVPSLPLAAASQEPGQVHFAIGNPGAADNFFWLYTGGRAKTRGFQEWRSHGGQLFLHHAAQVLVTEGETNPGDSGGPVANERGELVAVTQGASRDGKAIHFAIDVAEVRAYLEALKRAGRLEPPATADDFFRCGQDYLRQGRPVMALEVFQQVEAHRGPADNFTREDCLLAIAAAQRESGQFDQAIATCDRMLAENGPRAGEAYAERAAARLAALTPEAFITPSFTASLKLGGMSAWQGSAKLHDDTWGPRKQAVLEDVERALHQPNAALALRTRARYFRRAGDLTKELADRMAVLDRQTSNVDVLERAEAYALAGQYDRAIADCESVLGLAPILAHQRISEFHLLKGDLKAAAKAALCVAECLEPENPMNWEQLARIHEAGKDYAGVVEFLGQAIHVNEEVLNHSPVRWHYVEIGDALTALNRLDEARGAYRRALRIDDFVTDHLLTSATLLPHHYPRSTIEAKLRGLPEG